MGRLYQVDPKSGLFFLAASGNPKPVLVRHGVDVTVLSDVIQSD